MSRARGTRRLPVIGSIVLALILTIAPLPDWAAPFRPDWVAMTLIYWAIHLPHSYGVGIAWITGLIVDVAQGALLAQNALAMSLVVYLAAKFHLQLRVFPMSQLATTVFALLAIYRFLLFWINGVAGVTAPAASYWGPVVTGALLWPAYTLLLRSLRFRRQTAT